MTIADRAEVGEDAAVLLRELQLLTTFPVCISDLDRYIAIGTPEAHLAAAMMLVPEGIGYTFHKPSRMMPDNLSSARVWGPTRLTVHGSGPTPAHALIAAIARSMTDGSE